MFRKKTDNIINAPSGKVEWLIVCLGNPGKKYHLTRHNVGFLECDYISQKLNIKVDKLRFKSLCGDALIGGKRVLILKPQTFMNKSGEAVLSAMTFYKISIENVLVISDDVSLEIGKIRIRKKGSDGGHNGIKSIILLSNSDNFPRIKIGVGNKPHPDFELADWVLGQFQKDEQENIFSALINTFNAIELIVEDKIDEAMNEYN